ncbi:MAG: DUF3160 domain-containing protein [Solidesulfovibrio sp.]
MLKASSRRCNRIVTVFGLMSAIAVLSTCPGVALAQTAEPKFDLKRQPRLREAPLSLEKAANAKAMLRLLGLTLSAEQIRFLNDNKFLLIPSQSVRKELPPPPCSTVWDDMLSMSDSIGGDPDVLTRRPENAKLITPDAVLHAYHKLFNNLLEYYESGKLSRELYLFLLTMQRSALEERRSANAELAARLERIAAQLTLPLLLLENASWGEPGRTSDPNPPVVQAKPAGPIEPDATPEAAVAAALTRLETLGDSFSPETRQAMAEELTLIFKAEQVAESPLFKVYADKNPAFNASIDYSKFTPRGHYAKNGKLTAYFQAMAYLGLVQWPLGQEPGLGDALLVTLLMDRPGPGGQPSLDAWNNLRKTCTLFAGQPDDPGYDEIMKWLGWSLDAKPQSLAAALDPAVQEALLAKLKRTDGPKIRGLNNEAGLRVLGSSFTWDGSILSRLFGERDWAKASALFVPAALGNRTAREFAQEQLSLGAPSANASQKNDLLAELDKISGEMANMSRPQWHDSLAAAWLATLKTLGNEYAPGHPAYMRSKPFRVKELQSQLGSYAELKHDTILYAKQPDAECGEGSDTPPPPVPKGFVEPNLAFWQAMLDLVQLTRNGFDEPNLKLFEESVHFLGELARKELNNEPIKEVDYEKLRNLPLNIFAVPFEPGVVPQEGDTRTALVADVLTDRTRQSVLYEATGKHYLMLALVGNENAPRLVAGVAFNHYEFWGPLAHRETDQDWQAKVYQGQADLPGKNFWYKGLVPGEK